MPRCCNIRTIFLLLIIVFHGATAAGILEGFADTLLNSLKSKNISRMAILPFSDRESTDNGSERGKAVAEYLVAKIGSSGQIQLVDRIDFQKLLQEIDLSETALADEATVLRTGKILSADAILTGRIAELFGNIQITAKVVKTETGEVLAGAAVTVPKAVMDKIYGEYSGEQAKVSSAVFRSLLVPGWGQFYTGHPRRGTAAMVLCAGAAGYFIYTGIQLAGSDNALSSHRETGNGTVWNNRWDEYDDKLRSLEHDRQYDYDRMVTAGIITAVVWGLNCIDATVAGVQAKRTADRYFTVNVDGSRVGAAVTMTF